MAAAGLLENDCGAGTQADRSSMTMSKLIMRRCFTFPSLK
jgi:hypothetical protein